jgi:hypothetical protein
MRRLVVTALSLVAKTAMSAATPFDVATGGPWPLGAFMRELGADRPCGNGATVTFESSLRAQGLHEPTLSAFTVDLAPGGSAILHGTPSSGYVLVHVLSGAIVSTIRFKRIQGKTRESSTASTIRSKAQP